MNDAKHAELVARDTILKLLSNEARVSTAETASFIAVRRPQPWPLRPSSSSGTFATCRDRTKDVTITLPRPLSSNDTLRRLPLEPMAA
jgi:hypothetical protein